MARWHLIRALVAGAAALISVSASAQVKQSGTVTPQHVPYWVTSGVIADGGTSADSPISSLGVTNNGGNAICANSARTTAPGWQSLCLGVSTTGPGIISLQNYGTASPQSLEFLVNGVPLFPATIPLATNQQIYVGTGIAGVAGIVNLGTNLSISGGVLNATGGGGGGGTLPVASTSQLYGGSGTANLANVVNVGSGLSLSAGTLTATGGGGGGTGTAFRQTFYASTNFTPGLTTVLTLSTAPTSATAVWIWFDGVYQDAYTYVVAGTAVTFNAAIPSNVQVVEVTAGVAAGGFSPGGSSSNVQFNTAGTFAGNNGFTYDGTSKVAIGTPGSSTGAVVLSNTTSGTITLNPPNTGALGSTVLTVPAGTGTILTSFTPVTVPQGGTGNSALTAYAPLFGGTTSAGAIQAGTVGTLGQVLTSNGPGALPTFQAAGGSAGSTFTNAVTVCGAVGDGTTDNTTAITNCLATHKSIAFPIGVFVACNVPIASNQISIVGVGVQLSSNLPAGATPGGTVFECNSSTQNVFTVTTTTTSFYMQGFSCTKQVGVTPTAGSCIGYTGTPLCTQCIIRDVFSQNQYNGFALPPAVSGWLDNVWAFNNFNDGFYLASAAASSSNISWSGVGMQSILNNGYGFELVNTIGGFLTVGTWADSGTFANGLGGLYAHAAGAGNSINDLFLTNWVSSSDNYDCVKWDTNGGGSLTLSGGLIEQCGTGVSGSGNVGRNQSISPSHAGNGVDIAGTASNIAILGMGIATTASNGIGTASPGPAWITIANNFFYYDAEYAGTCGGNCNAITIGGFATNPLTGLTTIASVTGNATFSGPNQAYAFYTNSSNVTATGNYFAAAISGTCYGTFTKSGNIGTGC